MNNQLTATPSSWIVDIKGRPNSTFEISVLRSDNEHGKRSYGWFGDNKIFISGSGGPCNEKVSKSIWDRLVRVAHEVAADLNAIEVPATVIDSEIKEIKHDL